MIFLHQYPHPALTFPCLLMALSAFPLLNLQLMHAFLKPKPVMKRNGLWYDGAEICELVGLFILNKLGQKFGKENIGYTEMTDWQS